MGKESTEKQAKTLTIISKDSFIEGIVKSEGNLRLDGKFQGKILTKGSVVIGSEGIVYGDIVAETVTVAGKIKGKIESEKQVILESSSVVVGDVVTKLIIIKDGAVFHGQNKIKNIDKYLKEMQDLNKNLKESHDNK